MNTNYRVGDPVPVLGACGHDLTVEHVIVASSQKPTGASDAARYYALLCFTPGCERRYSWQGDDDDMPRPISR